MLSLGDNLLIMQAHAILTKLLMQELGHSLILGAEDVLFRWQFAVSAASTIEGFMSNNMNSNRPTRLSFGNYGTAL
jgi:hypothetical protein